MKLKYNFVINKIADKMVAVAVGDDLKRFNGFIKMNDETAYIFKMLKNDVTEEEIVTEMIKDFPDAKEEEIRETVNETIMKLKESNVI